jgi:hypothetical protein
LIVYLKECFINKMGQTLNLKSVVKVLASRKIMNKRTNRPLVPLLHENTVRFVGDQNGEKYFEIMNHTEFDLTVDILNTNKDKINKIDLLRPFERLIIERNEVLGCSMILEEYITDKGKPLMFSDEKSRCLGEIKIGFDRVFGASSSWEVDYCWIPNTYGGFRTGGGNFVCDRRTETDGGGFVCDSIYNTSRALLRAGDDSNKSDSKKRHQIYFMPLSSSI